MQYTFPADFTTFIDTGIFIKADGSRVLSEDWDIGAGRKIQTEKIEARSGLGLALYEDGGKGIFIQDGGNVGIGTTTPLTRLEISDAMVGSAGAYTYWPTLRITQTANKTYNIGDVHSAIEFYSKDSGWPEGLQAYIAAVSTRANGITHADTGFYFGVSNSSAKADYTLPALVIHNAGNVCIGTPTIGTSATKTLGIKSGTAPTSSPADMVQLWSADTNGVAGKAGLHIRAEDGTTHVLGNNVGIAVAPAARLHISSPNGLDAFKIETNQGGIVVIDEWGNLGFSHNGLGIRYDDNLSQVSFNNANDLYISSGWNSASPFNILLMPSSTGKVGLLTNAPASPVDINADTVRLRTARTPASAGATGNQGEICWNANYLYVCVAANTWKRAALTSW